jgi:glycine/D-amino acid oxidase-like deaminating enzyme/nitrite reductase/ring-hydroxylating ferredoxin subunit
MIYRDGELISIWQDSIDPYISINLPKLTTVYDVIIVGGGITGISTALVLQKAGKQCLVIEAKNLCFGTTGGTTAHLNTLLDTPYTTIQKKFDKDTSTRVALAVKEAINLIQSNIKEHQIDCGFEETDAFLFAQNESQENELENILEATTEAGITAGHSLKIPVPIPFTKALRAKGQAKFNPVQYVYGIASAFENAGGVIMQNCRVTGAESNELVEVETSHGIFKCKDLIYATHIPPGVNLLHLRCVPYRSYAMALTLNDDNYPQYLAYDMVDPYHYYRTQIVNNKRYLIVGGKDHKTAHEENTEQCLRKLESHIRKYYDVKEVEYGWSSQYYEPADGLPYIGKMPGYLDHIYVATGFGGNGMVYSGVAALTFREILLEDKPVYQDLFKPGRIKPIAGFVNFIKHNADVLKQFAGKWFSGDDLHQLVELAPGEGKIVTYNKQKLALYKDDEGLIHAINPVCTHLKCEVKWNGAEKSWDCPCHGARYSCDGKMLNGPADADLEQIEVKHLVEK